MADYHFEREARTPYSESYTIDDGTNSLGRLDVHFTSSVTHATLNVHRTLSDDAILELVEEIDAQVAQLREDKRNTLAAMRLAPLEGPGWSRNIDWLEAHVTSIDEQVADLTQRRDAILAAMEVM